MLCKFIVIGAATAALGGLAACGSTEPTTDAKPTAEKTDNGSKATATPKAKPKARPKTIGTGKATGEYAIASADGTASGKVPIRLKVTTPIGASVNWTMTCSQGLGSAGSKSGDRHVDGTTTLRLAKPSKDSTDCIIAATAQLDGAGTVRLRITG